MSELAILGGPRTRTEPYPEWPVWDQRDIDAVTDVIKSGRWGGYPYPGPRRQSWRKNSPRCRAVGTQCRWRMGPSRWRSPCAPRELAGAMR